MNSNYTDSILFDFMQHYGINKSSALKMCKKIRVSPRKPSKFVSEKKKLIALRFISQYQEITFKLKDSQISKFVYLYQIKHFKSFRHKFFYPINGQRTCTNGKTAKKQASQVRPIIYKRLKTEQRNKRKMKTKKNRKTGLKKGDLIKNLHQKKNI